MSQSPYPPATYPEKVGIYPAHCHSGSGYFYDDVLEYRVWCHPERGVPDLYEGDDYFHAFATHAEALAFARQQPGSEDPLVLVRQQEYIDEPQPGTFIRRIGERITEWLPEWLENSRRQPGSIEAFLANRLPESDILAKPRQSFCGAKTKPQ
ncbi:GCN5 family acetyltransferase [Eikenella sp. NML080894]|uniref:GCN5 family acetyltransferase n=2 Tax=Neisseriaceae TaxID=481 RepID=UPI0007E12476|nr:MULTISPECIES: GCN5 family acetyltransferase [Eikenella]OAM36928.1 GCN5 family acetyltransferase [Eikenella sp. NML080894]OAM40011.1 GCN5 family acetyltransferase [Eikenella sp. NML120348]OAM46145.1 GCN5 family acetyltransferase [Eikenella sp. NML99-0057]